MVIVHAVVIVTVLSLAKSQICTNTSWAISFDHRGQSTCRELDKYINGFLRGHLRGRNDPITNLEQVQCCSASEPWPKVERQVVYADWTYQLDDNFRWAFCPVGYFLHGLYRSSASSPGYLNTIESARCAKPASHPITYGSCQNVDTSSCMSRQGTCSCPRGFFVTGIYRADDDDLYNLKKMKCCEPVDKPDEINSLSKIQTRIMDTTLWNLANLAYYLGYEWSYGCRALNVGEDFYKDGFTWVAETKIFHHGSCDGYNHYNRLKLVFDHWGLSVKEIKYGPKVTESLQPESFDSGIIRNTASSSITESIERTRTVQDTITHIATTSFTTSQETSFQISFNVNAVFGSASSSTTYTTKYENSFSTTNEKSISNTNSFSKQSSITLGPMQAAKYNVVLNKIRTTVPYTAVVITKFSTEFKGFLRWSDGDGNFHSMFTYSHDRPAFNYRFGTETTPFYSALKRQSDSRSEPWLWNLMLQKYPDARRIINRLTDETQYEFTLNGRLEFVEGTDASVVWEKVNITKRDVLVNDDTTKSTHPYVAKSGPLDKPAEVQYPEVQIDNKEPVVVSVISVN